MKQNEPDENIYLKNLTTNPATVVVALREADRSGGVFCG